MRLIPILCLCCCSAFLQGQQGAFSIADYLPYQVGDSLVYQNAMREDERSVLHLPGLQFFRGDSLLRVADSRGGYRLERIGADGRSMYALFDGKGSEMIFKAPIQWLPAAVQQGHEIDSSYAYTLFEKGRKLRDGQQHLRVTVKGHDSTRTPLRNFADCLLIHTDTYTQLKSGARQGTTTSEWYAKGVGLVKIATETYRTDLKGARTSLQKDAMILYRAKVGGEWMFGKTAK